MSFRPVSSFTPVTFPSDFLTGVREAVAKLTQQVRPSKTVEQRANEIVELMDGATSHSDEKKIRDIILATPASELSALKRAIDLAGDGHDMVHMLHTDIDDQKIVKEIKDYFKKNAVPTGEVKVYSDIDDTFYSNWVDTRFPKKAIYPGVRAFYQALDKGTTDKDATGDMAFLSARPAILEDGTIAMLKKLGVPQLTLLEGKLTDNLAFTTAGRNKNIAATKVENFKKHTELFPEYGSVFIGDSGQGDAIAGAKMNKESNKPKAVYIHNVTNLSADAKAAMAKDGIVVFDCYLDAALDAYGKGLISRQGLRDVATAARSELDAMTDLSDEQKKGAQDALSAAEAKEAAIPYPTRQATAA